VLSASAIRLSYTLDDKGDASVGRDYTLPNLPPSQRLNARRKILLRLKSTEKFAAIFYIRADEKQTFGCPQQYKSMDGRDRDAASC
jgi:hypothetical protein